ncbi:MAG: GNAT family N-acetyltransferase [Parasporobacterium sp.]|nr:GNAT family N-acetyltransferase [Parasporobacterium sp.]
MYEKIQIPLLSLADICARICEQTGAEIIRHGESYITYATPGFLYARNFILKATESELEAILKEIADGLPKGLPGSISFTEALLPENYAEIFERCGFQRFISQTGMIFDMDHGFDETVNENISVMKDDQIVDWSLKVSEGFPKPREDLPFIELNKRDDVITYAYMKGGQIASTGMLLIDPELSGIHEVSTLSPFRGQGQGSAIILRMLQDLKERGIKSVSLQASDLGKKIYTPIGFETVSIIPTWIPAG